MEKRGGRPAGRAISPLELRHLRLLLDAKTRAAMRATGYTELLEDFVLELRDAGCSAHGIAKALGIGSTTVQRWTEHARQRRDTGQ